MTTDGPPPLTDGVVTLHADLASAGAADGSTAHAFTVEAGGRSVGTVGVQSVERSTGELSWAVDEAQRGRGYATRAVRLLVRYAFDDLGLTRLQARVPPDNHGAMRLAHRSGLRNEGRSRAAPGTREREYVLLARLVDDPEPGDRAGFRALLNSFLPRKRVIAQALMRDGAGRVLMCHPTYKDDWDLPGGVVEERESPHTAVGREITEELGLTLPIGALVLTDWMPPWGGWDDALCLVFDAGVHERSVLDAVVLQAREIREAQFLTVDEIRRYSADYTARRVEAALGALAADRPGFVESGRPI